MDSTRIKVLCFDTDSRDSVSVDSKDVTVRLFGSADSKGFGLQVIEQGSYGRNGLDGKRRTLGEIIQEEYTLRVTRSQAKRA